MESYIEALIHATAWSMIKPTAYGTFHLSFAIVGLLLSFFFAWKLRGIGDKGNKILLTTCGVFLLVCEVYKQLFYYYHIENHTYAWWIFPFQMCSVPMYLCLIAPWMKPGKAQNGMYTFMMLYNLLGGIAAFAEPSGIVHTYWTLTLHAFSWHMILVFIGLYLIFSNRGGRTWEDFKLSTVTFLVLCGIAFALNIIFREVSDGSLNNFFLGPGDSPLIVFKDISQRFGWYVSTILYIHTVILGAYLIYLLIQRLTKPQTFES